MEIGETFSAGSREEWREWLTNHHQRQSEVWLLLRKGAAGKAGLTLAQAQEEALCFGWVDSLAKSVDAERYALRFSPRRKNSHWTDTNKTLALKFLREGRMAAAGKAVLPSEVIQAFEQEI